MDKILALAKKYNLLVIEDAAQAIDSFYKEKPLGSIGDLGCFSFHETKNIQCGEGGLLAINTEKFSVRGEIIWEKGTNRSAFWRGEVDKYNCDIGSSFLPSEINTAFLYAQIEELENIQNKRKEIWNKYCKYLYTLKSIGIGLPIIPEYATNNAHMFYLVCRSQNERIQMIEHLRNNKINAVFHYICLHDSPYFEDKHDERNTKCKTFEDVWLGYHYGLMTTIQIEYIINKVLEFYKI